MKALILTIIASMAFLVSHQSLLRGADTASPDLKASDWLLGHQADLYYYLLRHAKLSETEKTVIRQQACKFFLEYWVRHRSEKAQFPPDGRFEELFKKLMKQNVTPFIDKADPLELRRAFDGDRPKNRSQFKPNIPFLEVDEYNTWTKYQKLVNDFWKFAEARKE